MGENTSGASERVAVNALEGWIVQGLHDGRLWANGAEHSDVREFAINEDRTLPASAGWLAVEYGRRFTDFDRSVYTRAWEAAIGLVWLRRRAAEDHVAGFEAEPEAEGAASAETKDEDA
jgi:hypothetical protein